MKVKLGPAGIGSVKKIEETFAEYSRLGIRAAEIPFTYGVYIRKREDAGKIRRTAEKFNINLSVHAPYWVNLNSDDQTKVEASKQRILKSCEVGHWLGAKHIVFHCGFFGKRSREETYENIKNRILEIKKEIEKNKWNIELCPETMGKVNVFGSLDEIAQLVHDTQCSFCLDIAHILARDKKVDFAKLKKLFPQKTWHCHFSGIEFTDKGERRHKKTEGKYWKWLFKNLPREKSYIIINEAPNPVGDSVRGLSLLGYTQ